MWSVHGTITPLHKPRTLHSRAIRITKCVERLPRNATSRRRARPLFRAATLARIDTDASGG